MNNSRRGKTEEQGEGGDVHDECVVSKARYFSKEIHVLTDVHRNRTVRSLDGCCFLTEHHNYPTAPKQQIRQNAAASRNRH